MDFLADHNALQVWLLDYGSFALFFLSLLGIFGLPIPEETLMVIAGILLSQQKLKLPPTFFAALLGSMGGISLSYCLGSLAGDWVKNRGGKWLGISKSQLAKLHRWFEHFGKWTLFIGYFIPGVRHFTGFFAGMTALSYRDFARFAYSGALLWVTAFLSIGYFFGPYWLAFIHKINIRWDVVFIIIIIICVVLYLIYFFLNQRDKHE